MSSDYSQVCLTDTPGIIEKTAYRLQEGMMDVVRGAVRDGDVFLVVTDAIESYNIVRDKASKYDEEVEQEVEEDHFLGLGEDIVSKLRRYEKPVIVCVNKVDLVAEDKSTVYESTPLQAVQTIQKWRALLPDAFAILPTCAAAGPDDAGVVALRSILLANDPDVDVAAAVRNLGRPVPGMFADGKPMISNEEARGILPLGPPLYDPDFFTDRTDRFCASELIRETLFEKMTKELPYCCEVRIETFDESQRYADEEVYGTIDSRGDKRKKKAMIKIGANILVERDSQKGIVVGKGGKQIKEVGMDARRKLEKFFGVKVRQLILCIDG
jgi:GTP-binding protein Era